MVGAEALPVLAPSTVPLSDGVSFGGLSNLCECVLKRQAGAAKILDLAVDTMVAGRLNLAHNPPRMSPGPFAAFRERTPDNLQRFFNDRTRHQDVGPLAVAHHKRTGALLQR